MAEMPQDRPQLVHNRGAPSPDTTATVDVTDLLARLADRTEELAQAQVRQEHAEADLKRKLREMAAERKAHRETRSQLEADCQQLEAECQQVEAECRELQAEVAREREARAAVEADLKRAQQRVAALQHQLQIVSAQVREEIKAGPQSRWRRSDT
jgi:chromosome segregation ATPase